MTRHFNAKLARVRQLQTNAHNLTSILDMAASGGKTDEILEKIDQAFAYHFKLERQITESFGVKLDKEHLNEHQKLLQEIRFKKQEWQSGRIDGVSLAEVLKAKFYFHSSVYDTPLMVSLPVDA